MRYVLVVVLTSILFVGCVVDIEPAEVRDLSKLVAWSMTVYEFLPEYVQDDFDNLPSDERSAFIDLFNQTMQSDIWNRLNEEQREEFIWTSTMVSRILADNQRWDRIVTFMNNQ